MRYIRDYRIRFVYSGFPRIFFWNRFFFYQLPVTRMHCEQLIYRIQSLYLNTLPKELKGVKSLGKKVGRKNFLMLGCTAIDDNSVCDRETETKTKDSFSS